MLECYNNVVKDAQCGKRCAQMHKFYDSITQTLNPIARVPSGSHLCHKIFTSQRSIGGGVFKFCWINFLVAWGDIAETGKPRTIIIV